MITDPTPLPWYLVNRDLKRELRLVPPGYHEKIGKARVYRHCGEDMHQYYINGNRVTLDEAADICSGRKPVPPYPKAKAATKRKRTPKTESLDTLPMFAKRELVVTLPPDLMVHIREALYCSLKVAA